MDSGAAINVISQQLAEQISVECTDLKHPLWIQGVNGAPVSCRTKCRLLVRLEGTDADGQASQHTYGMTFFVLPHCKQSLIMGSNHINCSRITVKLAERIALVGNNTVIVPLLHPDEWKHWFIDVEGQHSTRHMFSSVSSIDVATSDTKAAVANRDIGEEHRQQERQQYEAFKELIEDIQEAPEDTTEGFTAAGWTLHPDLTGKPVHWPTMCCGYSGEVLWQHVHPDQRPLVEGRWTPFPKARIDQILNEFDTVKVIAETVPILSSADVSQC